MLDSARITACAILAATLAHAAELPHAFRPVARPALPAVRGVALAGIDRFLLAALEAKRLTMNPEADRPTLIRRVCFDLTGLPPTAAEIDAFVADRSPDACGRMADRYLASRHYGERWGKFWLDAAGYADSNGYFNADSDRPLAWRYRDYVVRSFNADEPYDRFVRQQIAGDELAGYRPDGDVTEAMVEGLTATHFLRNAPDGTGESDGNPDEVLTDRLTVLEGNVQNVVNALLGLTVQCARCHDHKFEPVSQEEYYSLQALLSPVYNPARWAKPNDRLVPVGAKADLAARQRLGEQIDRQVKAARAGLTSFADSLREQLLDERLRDVDAATRAAVVDASKTAEKKRSSAQKALLKKHAKAADVTDDVLAKRFPEFGPFRDRVNQAVAAREKERPAAPERIAAFVETDPKPPPHHLLRRGQHGKPGQAVRPGVPEALSTPNNRFAVAAPAKGGVSTGRRTAFARWVTSPENPLFARVMVNRIWQHHFGTGLVSTSDNLGASGAKPSHPELLDHLASEFERSGWSVKAMHRLILASAAYRQSSAPRGGLDAADPDNRLLARFPLRRLDAEAVRDAMLHASGELDLRAGGPYVPSTRTAEGTVEVADSVEGARRRSLYLQQRRTQVVTFLQLFDAPSIVTTCGKRSPSTVPLQSLALLNSDFARARAKAFADRLAREAGPEPERLSLAFRLACGRPPRDDEGAVCEAFLAKRRGDARAWADLGQMLFASNAFLYVE
ncbi:MAG: DUF1549 and DUF1553 domain-containing protein [Gemmataceae bacterium]